MAETEIGSKSPDGGKGFSDFLTAQSKESGAKRKVKKDKKIGLSTEKLKSAEVLEDCLFAANQLSGIDFIDCAWRYGNEPFVGMALKHLKQKNNKFDLILPFQSKAWPTKFTGGINKSLKFSLQKIGAFSCMDTYFLHCPSNSWAANLLAYQQLIECMNNGHTKKIGLGNFDIDMLERLFRFTNKYPHVLQHNMSVNNLDLELLNYCQNHNIELQAYEPFGEFRANSKNPILQSLAQKYGCSIKNLLLAYLLELGLVPVVTSDTPEEIKQLAEAKKIQISEEDMDVLKSMNKYKVKKRRKDS